MRGINRASDKHLASQPFATSQTFGHNSRRISEKKVKYTANDVLVNFHTKTINEHQQQAENICEHYAYALCLDVV